MFVTHSMYSGESSTLIVNNWRATYDSRSEEFLDDEAETYCPLEDKFALCGIQVNETVYLERNATSAFSFPVAGDVSTKAAILHGPEIINGFEDEQLFLGVITNVHNKLGLVYSWFHNGQVKVNGHNYCLINIKEPGTYCCKVFYEELEMESETVNVVHESQRWVQ